MSDTATYVYAVARDLDDGVVRELNGVDGAPVRLVAAGPLVAVVSDVDREEFEARALEEHREDIGWLMSTAKVHHRVVDSVGREHVIVPLSLATVYFGDDRVREVLAKRRGTFDHLLEHLTGRSEWGVKAYARPVDSAPRPQDRPRSGAEYLRQRRRALRQNDAGIEEAIRAAEEVHGALGALAVDVRRHRPQDSALTGEPDRMVLNGAYLVPVDASGEFVALAAAFAEQRLLRVERTGPWVPYSFSQVSTR